MEKIIEQGWNLFIQDKFEEVKDLVEPHFNLEKCEDFSFLNLMGYVYLNNAEYDKSKEIFEKYISIAQEKNDFKNEHIGLHQLAMVYRDCGNYTKALELIEQEKEIIDREFPEDNLSKSVNYYEQGYIRLKLDLLDSANDYLNLSLKEAMLTDDLIARACAYRALGEVAKEKKSDEANNYFDKAIENFLEAGDNIGAEEVEKLKI
ncbi:MAG: tetratricopeptide repeat protein [Gemella sp.]|nr:tetratricopeptide repeat protein [Gemella sp.]